MRERQHKENIIRYKLTLLKHARTSRASTTMKVHHKALTVIIQPSKQTSSDANEEGERA